MPTALGRLLACPSASRALRKIVDRPDLPDAYILLNNCCVQPFSKCRHASTSTIATAGGGEDAVNTQKPRPPCVRRVRVSPKSSPWIYLETQSNFSSAIGNFPLEIDDLKSRHKYSLWVELLQFRERVYRSRGVVDIWRGMRTRGIDLPTSGIEADILWGTFIKNRGIVEDVVTYAVDLYQRTRNLYGTLYERILAHWLVRDVNLAYKYHLMLAEQLPPQSESLRRLALIATHSPASLAVFQRIYLASDERNIYDCLVPRLCDQGKHRDALDWHSLLIRRSDWPSSAVASLPIVEQFCLRDQIYASSQGSKHIKRRSSNECSKIPEVEQQEPSKRSNKFSRQMMNELLGEAHFIKPKEFDDAFCARLFATKAFQPGVVTKGLGMFGVETIGPLALREMCLRNPLDQITQRLKELKEAGISVGKSIFSNAIEKFTKENRLEIVHDLLESDQHPDVFEDTELQKELLAYFISKEDWKQVHRTLAILTIYHHDPVTESWNLLLRTHAENSRYAHVSRVIEDMRMNSIYIAPESLRSLHSNVLRLRRSSKRPVNHNKYKTDDLRFLTKTWLGILESGGRIPPWRWAEILRRYGTTGRLRELRRLVLWLLAWYSPRTAALTQSRFSAKLPPLPTVTTSDASSSWTFHQCTNRVPGSHPQHPLRKIFPPSFQSALIEWGFKAAFAPWAPHEKSILAPVRSSMHRQQQSHLGSSMDRVHWTYGLQLLAHLRDSGVLVQTGTVRKAVCHRLTILYGTGTSKKIENRIARERNPYSFEDMMGEAEKAWGKRLFHWPGREEEHSSTYAGELVQDKKVVRDGNQSAKQGCPERVKDYSQPRMHESQDENATVQHCTS